MCYVCVMCVCSECGMCEIHVWFPCHVCHVPNALWCVGGHTIGVVHVLCVCDVYVVNVVCVVFMRYMCGFHVMYV